MCVRRGNRMPAEMPFGAHLFPEYAAFMPIRNPSRTKKPPLILLLCVATGSLVVAGCGFDANTDAFQLLQVVATRPNANTLRVSLDFSPSLMPKCALLHITSSTNPTVYLQSSSPSSFRGIVVIQRTNHGKSTTFDLSVSELKKAIPGSLEITAWVVESLVFETIKHDLDTKGRSKTDFSAPVMLGPEELAQQILIFNGPVEACTSADHLPMFSTYDEVNVRVEQKDILAFIKVPDANH
jgi:hypothetical protein